MDSFAFIDIETTGSHTHHDRIIEIGILRVENGKLVRTYQTLINPETYVSPFIQDFTGINAEELLSAPTFEEVKEIVWELLDGCVFVAHNARFDYGFIKNEFKNCGITFSSKQLCTVKLSRALFPEHRHHNLDSIVERFGLECENRHRAFDDAKVLWDFLKILQKTIPEDAFNAAYNLIVKKPSLPQQLPLEILDRLPESPGVYIFYGEQRTPLYVGKSINIKDRVLSHFSGDLESEKEMNISQQIQDIETITTAGELSALFLESEKVKELQPIYNRKLRISHSLVMLQKMVNKHGYYEMILSEVDKIGQDQVSSIAGIFKTKKQAKEYLEGISKEYHLCSKLMHTEKTTTTCFNEKLGICYGACKGAETPSLYNVRFEEATSKRAVRKWPFSGAIIITEGEDDTGAGHLIQNWCYLGNISFNSYGTESKLTNDQRFDYDMYKIMESYIFSKRSKRIKELRDDEFENILNGT